MEFKKSAMVAVLITGMGFTGASQAKLIDRGGGMIYDSTTNLTWAADANLFKTQADANANLVSQIIAANNGIVINNTTLIHNLGSGDFDTSTGRMDWFGAQAWAKSLTLGGFTDWRLPTTIPAIADNFQFNSELGHLLYISASNGDYAVLFSTNFQYRAYWSGTESAPYSSPYPNYTDYAWFYQYQLSGFQGVIGKENYMAAWAVRTGDVAAVPLPAAVWLFGSGLGLLAFNHRRKNQNSQL